MASAMTDTPSTRILGHIFSGKTEVFKKLTPGNLHAMTKRPIIHHDPSGISQHVEERLVALFAFRYRQGIRTKQLVTSTNCRNQCFIASLAFIFGPYNPPQTGQGT